MRDNARGRDTWRTEGREMSGRIKVREESSPVIAKGEQRKEGRWSSCSCTDVCVLSRDAATAPSTRTVIPQPSTIHLRGEQSASHRAQTRVMDVPCHERVVSLRIRNEGLPCQRAIATADETEDR